MRNDDEIRALLSRLARRHPSGGTVVERAAIVAEGADSGAVVAWILDHAGVPEAVVDTSSNRGLHSPRRDDRAEWRVPPPITGVSAASFTARGHASCGPTTSKP
jgi:hypothetical protein